MTVSVPGASSSNESVLSILLVISVIGNIILGAPFIAGVVEQVSMRYLPPSPHYIFGSDSEQRFVLYQMFS